MVDSIQLAQDVTDIIDVKVEVTKKPDLLRKVLLDLISKVTVLEERIKELENGN